jgi:CMP-N-acetylneuraminic acid synthetase
MNILCIVPARSQSKKLPHKNIKIIAGKPLLAHSIEQSLASKHITRTIVATDSEEYAKISKQYGAEVPFLRSDEVSGDLSTDLETFSYMLGELDKREGYRPDIIVHLRPTSPIRSVVEIDSAIEIMLEDEDIDSVRSLVPSPSSPFKMWLVDETGSMKPAATCGLSEAYNRPRQELPEAYIHNGAIDIIRHKTIMVKKSMTGHNIKPFFMKTYFDIDSSEDFLKTEQFLSKT